jgi:flagellar protein FlaF
VPWCRTSLRSREAIIQSGASRYRQASRQALPARETEIAAFGAVNRMLEAASDDGDRIRALGKNHDLWSLLVKDLALDTNRLPAPVKAQLLSLGLWSMRYSTLAIEKKLPIEPLLEVNRNIAEGLALQASNPAAAPMAGPATA